MNIKLFFITFAIALFAILISFIGLVGSDAYGLISVFIVSFFVHEKIVEFFEENRINIIDKKLSSKKENQKTFLHIFVMFLGLAAAYGLFMYLFSSKYLLDTFHDILIRPEYLEDAKVQIAGFGPILLTNLAVLFTGAIFSIFFKDYAVSLFVSLGAVSVGMSTGYLMSDAFRDVFSSIKSLFFVIIPGSFTIFSLIIISVAAHFLVLGYKKYMKINRNEALFKSIARSCFTMFLVALSLNLLGTIWEALILPMY